MQVHDLFVADDAAADFLGDADEAFAELIDGAGDAVAPASVRGPRRTVEASDEAVRTLVVDAHCLRMK